MLEELQEVLSRDIELDPDRLLLVGVSGGPDSLCLLDALDRLGYRVIAAHYNHQLRLEAGQEAIALGEFCSNREIPFTSGLGDVPAMAKEQNQSIEEAAREGRYRFLFEEAASREAQAVAVGHTADDQVETVLMHFLRGAGLAGLSGMPVRALPNAWSDQIPLVRPLLHVWREQIEAYCRGRGLDPIYDASNLDTTYYRNRLRHELIPYLESFNPAIRRILWRTADVLRGELSIVTLSVEAAWEECLLAEGREYVALSKRALLGSHRAMQRHMLRRAIERLRPGLRDIDFAAIERTLDRLSDPKPQARIDLSAGLALHFESDRLWVANWGAELPRGDWPTCFADPKALEIPGEMALPEGWTLAIHEELDLQRALVEAKENTDPFQAWLSLDEVAGSLSVRTRRAGDRFKPLGMEGHSVKLAEFMINQKIPLRARESWPLVCADEEIVWVPGVRLAHPFRITAQTQRVIQLRLFKINRS
jgi:tRNA(Ile)-lysidine synthase